VWGASKDDELEEIIHPPFIQTKQMKQKGVVTQIKKVEILDYSAFWCCFLTKLSHRLAVCRIILLK
jgi:hypothetical protein